MVGVDQHNPPRRATAMRGAPSSAAHDPQRPIGVVVAEDSYVIREFLTATLSATPEVELVAVCSNGKELETAIEVWDPDVVLTDIRMPPTHGEEGVRIAAQLRETRPHVGVVVLSQYAEPAYALRLLEQGRKPPREGDADLPRRRGPGRELIRGACTPWRRVPAPSLRICSCASLLRRLTTAWAIVVIAIR